jgi:hypothetical protein
MSITFSANLSRQITDDTLFEGSLFYMPGVLGPLPDDLREIIDRDYEGDVDHAFWRLSQIPRSKGFWMSEVRKISDDIAYDSEDNSFQLFWKGKKTFIFYLTPVDEQDSLDVQMSNMNAKNIIDLLGLSAGDEDWYSGRVEARVLANKVDIVLDRYSKNPNFLVEFTRSPEHRDRFHDIGIDEGYILNKLQELGKLADFCLDKECTISWN